MIYKCNGAHIKFRDHRYVYRTYYIYLVPLCKSGSLMISVGGRRPIVVSDQVSEPSPVLLANAHLHLFFLDFTAHQKGRERRRPLIGERRQACSSEVRGLEGPQKNASALDRNKSRKVATIGKHQWFIESYHCH